MDAFAYITLAIRNHYDSGSFALLSQPLAVLAFLLDQRGRYVAAATISGFASTPFTRKAVPEIEGMTRHLREVLGDEAYEAFAHAGETMTTPAMAAYAYDQIEQARAALNTVSKETRFATPADLSAGAAERRGSGVSKDCLGTSRLARQLGGVMRHTDDEMVPSPVSLQYSAFAAEPRSRDSRSVRSTRVLADGRVRARTRLRPSVSAQFAESLGSQRPTAIRRCTHPLPGVRA